MNTSSTRWRRNLAAAADVACVAVAAALLWNFIGRSDRSDSLPAGAAIPAEPQSIEGAPTLGKSGARVALMEFTDFECPFCRRFAVDVLPTLDREYFEPGRVLFIVRHLPNAASHPNAVLAARAAACAHEQALFWEVHHSLFKLPGPLTRAEVLQQSAIAGIDEASLLSCLESDVPDRVGQDLATALALGVQGTPTFFVGIVRKDGRVDIRRRISGSPPTSTFRGILDEVLALER